MKDLVVKQQLKAGQSKVWKLKPSEGHYTFGSSRTADLFSSDTKLELWHGIIKWHNDEWIYINIDSSTLDADSEPMTTIKNGTIIKFSDSELSFLIVDKDIEINKFQLSPVSASSVVQKYQIYQVFLGDLLLENKVLPNNKKFKPSSIPDKIVIDPIPSSSWHVSRHNQYTLKQKTIDAEKPNSIGRIKRSDFIDADSAKGVGLTAIFSLIVILSYIFIPKEEKYIPVAKKALATRTLVLENPVKKEKAPAASPNQEKQVVKAPTAPSEIPQDVKAADSAPKNKVAGVLKGLNTSRISSLLSKVSAQGQKSKNVVVSEGVLAGSGSSGRALAALGKVDRSGSDWNKANGGQGFKVSTGGIGGGNNLNGFAQLSGGKVGKGGVGLIEDESEVVGGLDREEIASYIKTQLGQILYCYERQLSANKDLFGKVSIKFTISGTGKVEAQSISDSTLKNAMVEGCMLNKIASWKFPTPRGGTKVIVTYPFLFKSTN